jgi:predicted membrane chloride channel (bestrophin family)
MPQLDIVSFFQLILAFSLGFTITKVYTEIFLTHYTTIAVILVKNHYAYFDQKLLGKIKS